MPRKFFEIHVRPNHEAWLVSPLDERLAKNAVADANTTAARVFHHWKGQDPSQLYGATSEGQYRDELVARECADFALVRDVADAHKHVEPDRPSRRVTRSDQTGAGSMGWGAGGFGEGVYGGGPQLVITLDNDAKRSLTAVMKNVMEMWEQTAHTLVIVRFSPCPTRPCARGGGDWAEGGWGLPLGPLRGRRISDKKRYLGVL